MKINKFIAALIPLALSNLIVLPVSAAGMEKQEVATFSREEKQIIYGANQQIGVFTKEEKQVIYSKNNEIVTVRTVKTDVFESKVTYSNFPSNYHSNYHGNYYGNYYGNYPNAIAVKNIMCGSEEYEPFDAWNAIFDLYDMENMFQNNISAIDIFGGFDAYNFNADFFNTDGFNFTPEMPCGCSEPKIITLENSGTDMQGMFEGCSSLTSLDLSNFNVKNATNMNSMFRGCSSLTDIKFGDNFDTSHVRDMGGMFAGCSSLTDLDLRSFNTKNVTNMSEMFYDCTSLKDIQATSGNWMPGRVTDRVTDQATVESMFNNCGTSSVTYR